MKNPAEKLRESLDFIRSLTSHNPKVGLILGSGLGDFAEKFENKLKINTSEIPNYPKSTVEGHKGFLVFGSLFDLTLIAIQGRTHFYEGYDLNSVTLAVRIMNALGIKILIVTNAAGSVNKMLPPGSLMLITDHINLMFRSPLRGRTVFTDLSNPYSLELHEKIEQLAFQKNIMLKKGVLLASTGPTYETAAEVNMIRKFGADAVSMSTVPEVITANSLGIKTIGISCITNYATGIIQQKLSHQEVTETARSIKDQFITIVSTIISDICKSLV